MPPLFQLTVQATTDHTNLRRQIILMVRFHLDHFQYKSSESELTELSSDHGGAFTIKSPFFFFLKKKSTPHLFILSEASLALSKLKH